ncbi:AAA ATPase afg3, partial [Spiromyces aspiralis]
MLVLPLQQCKIRTLSTGKDKKSAGEHVESGKKDEPQQQPPIGFEHFFNNDHGSPSSKQPEGRDPSRRQKGWRSSRSENDEGKNNKEEKEGKDEETEKGRNAKESDPSKDSKKKQKADKGFEFNAFFGSDGSGKHGGNSPNSWLPWLIAAMLFYQLSILGRSDESREITWQEFRRTYLDRGLVERLAVVNRTRVRAYLLSASPNGEVGGPSLGRKQTVTFSIGTVDSFERQLIEAQNELGIPPNERLPVSYQDEVSMGATLLHFAPTLLLIGAFIWMSRRAGTSVGGPGGGGGIFGVGKSRAKLYNKETDIQIKFKDVAGCDEAKEEIMEFV